MGHKEGEQILARLVALDTEYHCDRQGRINKVHCACFTNANGIQFKKWLGNYAKGAYTTLIDEAAAFYNLQPKDMIIVVHCFDLAERRALKFLGTDNSKYHFICTYHLAKMLQNSFCKASARLKLKQTVFENDSEKIEETSRMSKSKYDSLSYAGLCKKYKLALIDTKHKEAMRKLCIYDKTEGNEQAIIDYCAEDTQFLIPLFKQLFNEYYVALKGSFCPLRPHLFDNLTPTEGVNYLISQTNSINEFGEVADIGLPVDLDRVAKVKINAPQYREKLKSDFNEKYPGSFKVGKDKLLHEDTKVLQSYLNICIDELHIKNYPTSSTGKLSLSSETLKEFFHGKDCFGEHYRQLNKLVRKLNGVSKSDDNPFNYIIDGNIWYESLQPYGTITSRCTPSTKRFIFGWHKSLYGLMNPKPGKWLVELDYGSQETFVQACICHDSTYNDIYSSKDIYLAFANKMKLIPDDDWNNLTKSELKEKYHTIRSTVKTLILGISYGMGAKKLSERLGISLAKAERYIQQIGRILKNSSLYKSKLSNAARKSRAFSLPDGFICQSAKHANDNNCTTIINWPFQSGGGMILRVLVHKISEEIKRGNLKANLLSTIHDAIFVSVDENDYETINKVSNIMRLVANKVLNAPEGWSIKVGDPEIIKQGEIWTPEGTFNKQFEELLNYKS